MSLTNKINDSIDLTNIQIDDYIDLFIELFVCFYGEEYRDTVTFRLKDFNFLNYIHPTLMDSYYLSLKLKLQNYYALKFLEKLGIDFDKDQNNSSRMDYKTQKLCSYYLGKRYFEDEKNCILSKENKTEKEISLYYEVLKEYKNALKEFSYLEKFSKEHLDSYHKFCSKQRDLILHRLLGFLPYDIITFNREIHLVNRLLPDTGNYFYPIEFFDTDTDIDSLSLENLSSRLEYFRAFSIPVPDGNPREVYKKLLEDESIQSIVPDVSLVKRFVKIKEEVLQELEDEFVTENGINQSRISNIKDLKYCSFSSILDSIRKKRLCSQSVLNYLAKDIYGYTNIILFYLHPSLCGKLDYALFHELVHTNSGALDSLYGMILGFQIYNEEKNPYNDRLSIHENFNETITDLHGIAIRDILHEFTYLLEDERIVNEDVYDYNSDLLVKNLILPFHHKFSSVIKKYLMDHDKEALFHSIPEDVIEQINEIVNVVSDLIDCDLKQWLKEHDNQNPIVQEYYFQLDMLQDLYDEIGVSYYGPMPLPAPTESNEKVKKILREKFHIS